MYAHSVKTFCVTFLVLIGLAIINPVTVAADASENFKVVDGVAIYLGVMPAQIAQGHPSEHPEASMHGGVTMRGHRVHVVVALFDNTTGQRIENAQVDGSVMEPGFGSEQKKLEAMRIADSITYGNYFDMQDNTTYNIRARILRPEKPVIEAKFSHRHFSN